jgi:hypothetical protein
MKLPELAVLWPAAIAEHVVEHLGVTHAVTAAGRSSRYGAFDIDEARQHDRACRDRSLASSRFIPNHILLTVVAGTLADAGRERGLTRRGTETAGRTQPKIASSTVSGATPASAARREPLRLEILLRKPQNADRRRLAIRS